MTLDVIGDLLTRIRNAYLADLREIHIPHSNLKEEIVRILKKNKYIADYKVEELENNKKHIALTVDSASFGSYTPTFTRISRPGQRIYIKAGEIRKSRNGKGIFIVSTPKGVMTGYEARSLNVGGELLCEVF